MSRFCDGEGGIRYELWETIVGNALAGRRGQQALADLESALLALPERRLVSSHLAYDGSVCAIGAMVAQARAREQGLTVAEAVERMNDELVCWCGHGITKHYGDSGCCTEPERRIWNAPAYDVPRACSCKEFEPLEEADVETAHEGVKLGLRWSVAWHFAWMNDEQFQTATPEERYEKMLAFARRAQGKEAIAA